MLGRSGPLSGASAAADFVSFIATTTIAILMSVRISLRRIAEVPSAAAIASHKASAGIINTGAAAAAAA
jgi:hypothetical protein